MGGTGSSFNKDVSLLGITHWRKDVNNYLRFPNVPFHVKIPIIILVSMIQN